GPAGRTNPPSSRPRGQSLIRRGTSHGWQARGRVRTYSPSRDGISPSRRDRPDGPSRRDGGNPPTMERLMKTSDLIEQRAAIVARMTEAHEADDGEAFAAAEAELRNLDAKLERQRKIDEADRAEPGRPINGDAVLDREIRSRFRVGRAIAAAAGLSVDAGF